MEAPTTKSPIGRIIGFVAALVALLCFFMPWVEVGVSFVKTSMSGYQLATGSGPAGLSIASWTSLLLVPACMLAAVALVLVTLLNNRVAAQDGRAIPIALIAAGGLSVVVITYFYFNLNAEFNKNLIGVLAQNLVSYAFGWGASLLSSIAVMAGGLFELRSTGGQPRRMAAGGF